MLDGSATVQLRVWCPADFAADLGVPAAAQCVIVWVHGLPVEMCVRAWGARDQSNDRWMSVSKSTVKQAYVAR